MQSKKRSIFESIVNVLVGCGVALVSQYIVFPWYGIDVPLRSHLGITLWFTAISLARSYVIRRWFTKGD